MLLWLAVIVGIYGAGLFIGGPLWFITIPRTGWEMLTDLHRADREH